MPTRSRIPPPRAAREPAAPAEIFRAIADYTYDWESWVDVEGTTRWINPAVQRITGFTVAECLAMKDYPLPLVHRRDRARIRRALRTAHQGGSGNDLEFRVQRKDGTVGWGAISWQSLFDTSGICRGYRTSVRDISARKQAEDELRQAKVTAEQASRAKGEFLANMSHELRSPIQCISGYAELLSKTKLTPKQKRYLAVLGQQNEALLKVVDDILDFSALQAVMPRLEELAFDVADVVTHVIDGARPLAQAKGLTLTAEIAPPARLCVSGDVHRLRQILANLVSNALKFTERGSVTLHVARGGPKSDDDARVHLSFAIADTGIGISPDSLRHLFRPFAQGDTSTARRFGGTGLGLAISRRLSELMGGELVAESRAGHGSVFTLSLPFVEATPPPKDTRPQRRAAALPPLAILVVEDNPVALALALELLRVLGYKAQGAPSGPEALAHLERKAYDLVLMDVQMPVMDGLTLTRTIRQRRFAHGGKPTIVALTANVLADDRRACLDAGMDAFLGKPLRLEVLRAYLAGLRTQAPSRRAARPPSRPVALDEHVRADLERHVDASGRSLLSRYAPRIVEDLRKLIAAIEVAVNTNVTETVLGLAHQAKGHAKLVGATETVLACERLDRAARTGNEESVRRPWPACRRALVRLIATLEPLAPARRSSDPG